MNRRLWGGVFAALKIQKASSTKTLDGLNMASHLVAEGKSTFFHELASICKWRTLCYGSRERATKTREHDLLRRRVGQKEPPRPENTICYGEERARKSQQDPKVRIVTDKSGSSGPERARPERTICCG